VKRIFIPCCLLTIFILSYVVFGQVEKGGTQKTIRLQSGEVIYDLTGEWNVIHKQYDEHYGSLEWIGSYRDIVKVKQEGYKFVGIKVVGDRSAGKEAEIIRGELDKRGFIKGQIYRADTGWRDCQGKITNDCKRIILNEGNVAKATLERK
jgi:hypothetical protein